MTALAPEAVLIGILTSDNGAGAQAADLRVHGLPAVVRAAAARSGHHIQHVWITVGGTSAKRHIANDNIDTILGVAWLPWGGAPTRPPEFPTFPGLVIEADADAVPTDPGFLGGGPQGALRTASLGHLQAIVGTCGEASGFASGLAGDPALGRALSVAYDPTFTPRPLTRPLTRLARAAQIIPTVLRSTR